VGRKGTVQSSAPKDGGYGLLLSGSGAAIGAGDWLAVSKQMPGDPASGWWPSVTGGARLEAERKDLSPETRGSQALRIEAAGAGQSAELKSYFDTLEGYSFVRLRGRYRLSFRAKALSGARTVHVHVRRIANGRFDYLEQDFELTPRWADYYAEFEASEGPLPAGRWRRVSAWPAARCCWTMWTWSKPAATRRITPLFAMRWCRRCKELHPGVLRLMSAHAELGSTIDNLLLPPMARQRPGFSTWLTTMEDIPVGIPEFLELCREVGAEPWIVAPTAMSEDEARTLAEYLSGTVQIGGWKAARGGGASRAVDRGLPDHPHRAGQ
jgi:hypothetical protein